jgi:predicted nucleic acid-binding protein
MNPKVYYWDSSVFIPYFNASNEPQRAAVFGDLLKEAESGHLIIVTSDFTLVEVIKLDAARKLSKAAEQTLTDFFDKPYLRFVTPERTVCESARSLIWKHTALYPKDAVHLASALFFSQRSHLDALFSYDTDFTKLNGKLGASFPIVEPYIAAPTLDSWAEKNEQKSKTTEGAIGEELRGRPEGPVEDAAPKEKSQGQQYEEFAKKLSEGSEGK